MPSVSKKQHNLMAMVAHNPKAAKRLGIPQSVGQEFMKADTGRKFREGGEMAESKKMMKREVAFMKAKGAPKSMVKHEEAEYGMKKGGKCYAKGGKVKKMADGGAPTTTAASTTTRKMPNVNLPSQANIPTLPSQASDRAKAIMAARLAARTPATPAAPAAAPTTPVRPAMKRGGMAHGEHSVQRRGHTKGTMVKMAKGGYVKSADGITKRGKTKGKIV